MNLLNLWPQAWCGCGDVFHGRALDFCLYFSLVFLFFFHFADMLKKSLISNWLFCPLVLFLFFLCLDYCYCFGVTSPSVSEARRCTLWRFAVVVALFSLCSSCHFYLNTKSTCFHLDSWLLFFFLLLTVGLRWVRRVLPIIHWRLLPFPALALPRCLFCFSFLFLFFCNAV